MNIYHLDDIPDDLQQYFQPVPEIGMEQSPDEYVANMVEVFRLVRDVLADDGVVFLNLGDSYANNGVKNTSSVGGFTGERIRNDKKGIMDSRPRQIPAGLKPKDLIGIPWRVAFALQADGWYLRSEIIWHKPNPMPESVTDRPTKAHEQVFLLAKSERYFYDAEAIKEPFADERQGNPGRYSWKHGAAGIMGGGPNSLHKGNGVVDGWNTDGNATGRNRRSVWTVASESYSGSHFATFPRKLIEPMILAGCPAQCCPVCGKGWVRVVEREGESTYAQIKREQGIGHRDMQRKAQERGMALKAGQEGWGGTRNANGTTPHLGSRVATTTGWQPACTCDGVDRRIILSPTGERAGNDPSMATGRAGMNRPRGKYEGQRPITRYEQSQYAKQLRESPHRSEMRAEAGQAFDHYLRTDDNGARPIPDNLLETWIDRGWLDRVIVPLPEITDSVPGIVLDPFMGSGTTGQVAQQLGRQWLGIELNANYGEMQKNRTRQRGLELG